MQPDGMLTEGFLDAGNRHEALRQVEILGLKPIRLTEAANGPANRRPRRSAAVPFWDVSLGRKRKSRREPWKNFTRLLSSLLAAGVPFSRALVILQREGEREAGREGQNGRRFTTW